jgi:hypothetical protein
MQSESGNRMLTWVGVKNKIIVYAAPPFRRCAMKSRAILLCLFVCLVATALAVITGCGGATSTPAPTPSTPSIPTPKFTTPGTGAAVGQVMFPDGTPAYQSVVYIFKSEETQSFASCYVDTNGYYIFDNLPVGRYDIYTSSYASYLIFTRPPKATITVSEHETATVPSLTELRNIKIALDNPKTASIPGESYTSHYVIDGHNPKFTWTSIPNALYYTVTIEYGAVATETIPQGINYTEKQEVTGNKIIWPTSLSALPYHDFGIEVEAYMKDGTRLGYGSEGFSVDEPPNGWVYNNE